MKYNILTFLAAALMVAAATLALSSGMWIYEHDQLDAEEMRKPTTISTSMGTIYSNSTQDLSEDSGQEDPEETTQEQGIREQDQESREIGTQEMETQEGESGD